MFAASTAVGAANTMQDDSALRQVRSTAAGLSGDQPRDFADARLSEVPYGDSGVAGLHQSGYAIAAPVDLEQTTQVLGAELTLDRCRVEMNPEVVVRQLASEAAQVAAEDDGRHLEVAAASCLRLPSRRLSAALSCVDCRK